jgi:hypothetical protein
MSIDFNFFIMLLFTTPSAVVLSVCIGVGGCLCPKYSSVCRAEMAYLQLMERAPISASATDDMSALMICEIVRIQPLLLGIASLLDMKKCQPALLRALVSKR